MRKQCALDRIGEAIPHIKWTDLTVTKDCQMSKGQERDLSDESFSVGTESKDRVNLNVFPSQDQSGVVKDYKQTSPNHVFNIHLNQKTSLENKSVKNEVITFEENSRSLPANMLLISEMESESVGTDVCEVTTKVTNIADISTNDLPEIKVQGRSILKDSFHHDKLPSAVRVNHTNQETWTENETQVVDATLKRGSQKFGTLEMDVKADNVQKESLEYCKDCNVDFKTQILCHRDVEIFDIRRTMAIASAGDFLGQKDEVEVLDLSLPKKKERMKERQCEWVVDPEYEGSLHMEVDEIEDDHQHEEVEQDDYYENGWIPSGEAQKYLPQHWDGCLSPSSLIAMSTSTFTSVPMTPDTLLIDDQGIPYVLTPDGQKVPQIDNIQDTEEPSEKNAPSQVEDNVQDVSESRQKAQPDELGHVSVEASQVVPNLESKSVHSVVLAKSSVSSAMSELASVPIQIMANTTGSNTPILLLSPSQLQTLSSPAFKTNPGLITLSLPVQSTPTSSVFLVLSSPQVSSTQSSSPTEQLCQSSCTSTVALPLAACPLDLGSKLCERPSPLSHGSSPAADISGLNNPSNLPLSPTSSTVSSSTSTVISTSPTKQPCTDAYSGTSMPTSFREALVRLAVSAEKKIESLPQSIKMHSVDNSSSFSENSSATVHDINTHETATNCDEQYPAIETMSASVDQTDTLSTNDCSQLSSRSPLRPVSPAFPINDSKNQDSQGLGPRRILYCQYCPRIFYYLSDLERHSITHSQNKPHVCQLCNKAFKRSSHLERHKHIHTGQRNFVCQLCPRRFRESGELMRHQRVHTGEKPFQCLICHMRFAERNTLRRHTKRKHQGQQQQAMDMNAKAEGAGISLVGIQDEPEDNAEWYISTLPEMETDSDMGGEGAA